MSDFEQQSIKKLCSFYVSNVHLSVMLLPYISNEVNEDVEITAIFEEINKEEIEQILNRLNIRNKEKILNINLINKTEKNFENKLNNCLKKEKRNTIIIGGSQDYVFNVNRNIQNFITNKNTIEISKIIDCYNIEELTDNINLIANQYDKIMNTITCLEVNNIKK